MIRKSLISLFSIALIAAHVAEAQALRHPVESRKLDVLFVIDNSGSMGPVQNKVVQSIPRFVNEFKENGYDFRMAVTTTDAYYGDQFSGAGCSLCHESQSAFRGSPRFVDQNTPQLIEKFVANINVGISGSGDERAFSSFKAALQSPMNASFHRPEAYLAVIIISDEEDFSHDSLDINESYTQSTLHPVAQYKTFLEDLTAGHAGTGFSVSTISILDDACRLSLNTYGKVASRYMEIADITGGSKNSLCDSMTRSFDNIRNLILTHIE